MTGCRFVPLLLGAAIAPAIATGATETVVPADARYAVQGGSLQPAPGLESADGRYHLAPRLEPAEREPRAAGAFSLRAKLVDATATACPDPNDIFSNGFE